MFKPQLKIPATYMRGGTSKGVFFGCRIYLKRRSSPVRRVTSCYCG